MTFWKGKRVLVGGGCGFLGSYLVPQLVDDGAIVTVVDNLENGYLDNLDPVIDRIEFIKGDLEDMDFCKKITKDRDVIINLAAKAFGMAYSRIHNGEMLVHNLLCTLTPLEAARMNNIDRYLIVSSSCVYPDEASVPTAELDVFSGLPESVNAGYGWSKRIEELAGSYYANEYGMKVSIVRPFNPYGDHYRWGSEDKAHVIPALVKRIMDGEDPLVVWGSGQQRRNFLHASDATRLILLVIEKEFVGEPVNIGYEDTITIADLVNMICDISGKHPKIVFDTSKPEGRFCKSADATLLKKVTENYQPHISLHDGITEMIGWHKKHFGPKQN